LQTTTSSSSIAFFIRFRCEYETKSMFRISLTIRKKVSRIFWVAPSWKQKSSHFGTRTNFEVIMSLGESQIKTKPFYEFNLFKYSFLKCPNVFHPQAYSNWFGFLLTKTLIKKTQMNFPSWRVSSERKSVTNQRVVESSWTNCPIFVW